MSIGMAPYICSQKMWTNETNIFHVVCIFVPEHTYLPWWFPSILIGAVEIDRNKHKSKQIHTTYNYKKWKGERQESQQKGHLFCVISCHFRLFVFCCLLKITSAALISLYWHSDIQGAKRLLPWVVTYWRHCCPLNLRPLLLRNFGPKNNVIAKDFLFTGWEQPCTRINQLFVWFVDWLSPCLKWPNMQENGL